MTVVQFVPKMPGAESSVEQKRRILFIFALSDALKKAGMRTLLSGFVLGDDAERELYKAQAIVPGLGFAFSRIAFALVAQDSDAAANFKTDSMAVRVLKDWSRKKIDAAILT